jgi:hypothetical protein
MKLDFLFPLNFFLLFAENKFAVGSGAKSVCICYYEQENNWYCLLPLLLVVYHFHVKLFFPLVMPSFLKLIRLLSSVHTIIGVNLPFSIHILWSWTILILSCATGGSARLLGRSMNLLSLVLHGIQTMWAQCYASLWSNVSIIISSVKHKGQLFIVCFNYGYVIHRLGVVKKLLYALPPSIWVMQLRLEM